MPLYKVSLTAAPDGNLAANTRLLEEFTKARHGRFLGPDRSGDGADQDLIVVSLPEEAISDLTKEPFVDWVTAPGARSHIEVLSEPTYSGLN